METNQIFGKLKAGYELYNRGTNLWLNAPKHASDAADGVKIDGDLMNELEPNGTLRIVMLMRSMQAKLLK